VEDGTRTRKDLGQLLVTLGIVGTRDAFLACVCRVVRFIPCKVDY
jgi:hypothetical protein